jgi:hypothetical protein
MMQGWALAEQGQGIEKRVAQILQGLAAFRATGAEVGRPKYLTLLVEAYGKVGQREEGLSAVAEALAMVHQNEERCCEAELYRLKGTLLLQVGTERGSGSLLPAGPGHGPAPAGPILGAASGHEPEPTVAAAGQVPGSARLARADLRLVHRGL